MATDPLELLVREHQTALWRFLRALGCSPLDADELAVEALAIAHEQAFVPESHTATATYLRRVARYLWLRRRRESLREARRHADAVERLWQRYCPDGGGEFTEALRTCIAELSGRSAEAVQLCYFDELPHVEAARRIGLKPNGLKTLLQRVRASLRACVERRTR